MTREPTTHPDALDRILPALAGLAALMLLALFALPLVACHPRLPPVSGCAPEEQSCRGDRPHICSASQRWEPAGDIPCAAVGGVCVVRGGGSLALCERARDAGAADAAEGD